MPGERRLSEHYIERGIWPVLSMVGMWHLCVDRMCPSTTNQEGTQRRWACLIGGKNHMEVEAWELLGYLCTKIIIMLCTKVEPITMHSSQIS